MKDLHHVLLIISFIFVTQVQIFWDTLIVSCFKFTGENAVFYYSITRTNFSFDSKYGFGFNKIWENKIETNFRVTVLEYMI